MRALCLAPACLALAACSSPQATHPALAAPLVAPLAELVPASPMEPAPEPEPERAPEPEPEPPFTRLTEGLLEDGARSVAIEKSTWVLASPSAGAARLGLIRGGARAVYRAHVENEDCETPWVEIEPAGFACAPARSSQEPPSRPRVRRRALSGTYAIAAAGARFYPSVAAAVAEEGSRPARGDMIRRRSLIELEDGRILWKTDRNEYVEASQLRRLWGSRFRGVRLDIEGAPELPLAFAVHRRRPRSRVPARRAPSLEAPIARRLSPRQVVSVGRRSTDGAFVEIEPGMWVERRDLRIVEAVAAAPEEAGEAVWADVDLEQQLVVLYRGTSPIFATLTSSGRAGDETPTGTYRVTRKKVRTTMRSDRSRRQTYSVAVPWATYFHEGYAFHSAYWHDGFGKPRSHGCLNLSPADALTVFELLGPGLQPGWTVVYGHDSQPGSVVRIRSAENPTGANPDIRELISWLP